MRQSKPKSRWSSEELVPWEWAEFIKVKGYGWMPVSLYELYKNESYGHKVRFWMTTRWVKVYSSECVRMLKNGTQYIRE